MSSIRGYFRLWKSICAILIPMLFLQLAFSESTKSKCAFVLAVMSCYWMFGIIPESVTALLPIALFPLLGILSTSEACALYMKPAVMMMICGLILAFAIEDCNLHKRVALKLLIFVGTGVKKILLGLMLATMFLSFWISNTATTAMMLPVTDAIVNELSKQYMPKGSEDLNSKSKKRKHKKSKKSLENEKETSDAQHVHSVHVNSVTLPQGSIAFVCNNQSAHKSLNPTALHQMESGEQTKEPVVRLDSQASEELPPEVQTLRIVFFLSVAYSANIGGTGTITGTAPNLVLQGIMDELYPQSNDLSFATWMMYAAPCAVILILFSWCFMQFYFLRKIKSEAKSEITLKKYLLKNKQQLGSLSFHEMAVSFFFILILILWFMRDPRFIPGWEKYVNSSKKISDATPAMFVLILMFIIPANLHQFRNFKPDKKKPIKYLLNWRSIVRKMPWGVILLIGGGFSLAEGTMKSGLSSWFGGKLSNLEIESPKLFLTLLVIFSAFLTEITSNSATAAVILPVINQAALSMRIHPLYFMLPITISVSFAFMLPVATPCNALVYEHLKIKTSKMIKPGLCMNIICIILELMLINTLGDYIFNFSQFPDWAEKRASILYLNSSKI